MRRNLPPDPEGKNDDRAEWAGVAIQAFRNRVRTDSNDALSDLLRYLMHWADRNEFNFDAQLRRARRSYRVDTSR